MNIRELREIFRLVEKTDFTEVEIVQGDWRLRVERGKAPVINSGPTFVAPTPTPRDASPVEASTPAISALAKEAASPGKSTSPGYFVTSPFVGTFYRSPSPDTDVYVEVGQMVKAGQPLCIVEAMKLMNEIETDYDGRVAEIFVENATPVEFGENLFRIERNG